MMTSVTLPAAIGTITRIGRSGYVWAFPGNAQTMSTAAIDAATAKPRRARASDPRESLVMTLPCGAGTVRRG
jgi:hypothetical protein